MRVLFFSTLILGLLGVSVIRAASPPRQPNSVAQALLWQVRQYTYIKTIHFQAVVHNRVTTVRGKIEGYKERYEYWGAGIKYRIDYQQFAPQANFDVLVTDNGRHYRMFDRISSIINIGPTHPTSFSPPVMQNPILEPLVPLAPYFPFRHHKWTPHVLWMNLARIDRNSQSVFNRCRQVWTCGKKGPGGSLQGCILGSFSDTPAHVRFRIVGGGGGHPLVTGWMAREYKHRGSYMRLIRIKYRSFRLSAGRIILLPVAFEERGMVRNWPGPYRGSCTSKVVISHVSIDQPISPGKFTINYELAHSIIEVTGHGKSRKFHYITVHPTTRPAPPRAIGK